MVTGGARLARKIQHDMIMALCARAVEQKEQLEWACNALKVTSELYVRALRELARYDRDAVEAILACAQERIDVREGISLLPRP